MDRAYYEWHNFDARLRNRCHIPVEEIVDKKSIDFDKLNKGLRFFAIGQDFEIDENGDATRGDIVVLDSDGAFCVSSEVRFENCRDFSNWVCSLIEEKGRRAAYDAVYSELSEDIHMITKKEIKSYFAGRTAHELEVQAYHLADIARFAEEIDAYCRIRVLAEKLGVRCVEYTV